MKFGQLVALGLSLACGTVYALDPGVPPPANPASTTNGIRTGRAPIFFSLSKAPTSSSAVFGPQVTVETARPFADQAAAGMLAQRSIELRAQYSWFVLGPVFVQLPMSLIRL